MRRYELLCACGTVLLAACRGGSGAASTDSATAATEVPTLRQLATAWSGGQTQPSCQTEGPNGEYLGLPGERYCVWPTPTGASAPGEVSAHMLVTGRVLFLHWVRPTADSADADRLVDSLGTALTSRGLIARACPSGDVPAGHVEMTRWEAPTLIVELSRIAPATGAPKLSVMAGDDPRGVPDVLCPRSVQ